MKKLYVMVFLGILLCGSIQGMDNDPKPATIVTQAEEAKETLMVALRNGDLDEIKRIFSQDKSDVNQIIKKGCPALIIAAVLGHESIVRYLIDDKKAKLFIHPVNGMNVLMFAARQGHLNIVKYFVEHSNPTIRSIKNDIDKCGLSAFYHAAEEGKLDVVKYFAERADFNLKIDGSIALSLANSTKKHEVVQYLVNKGVPDLPKQYEACTNIFYDNQANKHVTWDCFDIVAHTTKPIEASTEIPSLSQGGTLQVYQQRVSRQNGYDEECVKRQLESAVNTLGGTQEMHCNTSPIFGGSCAYHALKNAFVGLVLFHDYDLLVEACNKNNAEEIKKRADFVTADILNFTTFTTGNFDCAKLMEEMHAKVCAVQYQPQYEKISAINIQQGLNSERQHIIRTRVDAALVDFMVRRKSNTDKQHDNLFSFVDGDTIRGIDGIRNSEADNCENLYSNNTELKKILSRIDAFDLLKEIALFRTNSNYRHAFILSLDTAEASGWCTSFDAMHAITVIIDKRDARVNSIICESNNIPAFAIKQILFDFIDLFIDDQKYSMTNDKRNDLLQCASHSLGLSVIAPQKKLPSFTSLMEAYKQAKKVCEVGKKRDDVHLALFLLSKIQHIAGQAALTKDECRSIQTILKAHNLENNLRAEEIALYDLIQKVEERELIEQLEMFISFGQEANVRDALVLGVNLTIRNSHGNTFLITAAHYDNVAIVKCLVENGAEIDAKNNQGQTPLMIACERGNLDVIEYLLQRGAQINVQDENGYTPVMYAAGIFSPERQKRFTISHLLVEKYKADLNLKTKTGQTVLMVHAICGSSDVFNYLIEKHTLSIDLDTVVNCIAKEEVNLGRNSFDSSFSIDLIEYCIQRLNLNTKMSPRLVLDLAIEAAKNSRINVIKRLCQSDCGFDINAQDSNDWTVLMHAVNANNIDALKKIIEECRANVHLKNKAGQTAFDIAVKKANFNIIDFFIKKGVFHVETSDSSGFTPLLSAAANCNANACETLIKYYNANINAKDKEGRTALMLVAGKHIDEQKCKACKNDQKKSDDFSLFFRKQTHLEMVKLLITLGIDVNATDCSGQTALEHALSAGRTDVAEYLSSKNKAV